MAIELEGDLSRDLHDAVVARGGNNAERARRSRRSARRSKVRVIERVEGFSAKLEVQAFAEFEVPEQTEIEADEAGSADHSALLGAHLAESPGVEAGGQRRRECAAIEPLLTRADL